MERIYIERKDSEWHPMNVEMPPHSTDVELLKPDGTIIKGEIVAEMSGYYIYLRPGWGDMDDYTHWRFIADDNNMEHLTELAPIIYTNSIDFKDDGNERPGGYSGKGLSLAADASINLSWVGRNEMRRCLKRLGMGRGRLPRKEKKRRINSVMRDKDRLLGLVVTSFWNPWATRELAAVALYPECVGPSGDGKFVIRVNGTQDRLIHLFAQRIRKNNVKLLKKLWTPERRGKCFNTFLEAEYFKHYLSTHLDKCKQQTDYEGR